MGLSSGSLALPERLSLNETGYSKHAPNFVSRHGLYHRNAAFAVGRAAVEGAVTFGKM